jgi:hypothetical protein
MKYESVELELEDDEYLRLVCSVFDIKAELLEDIKTRHTDFKDIMINLVLSEAVARVMIASIKAEESLKGED